MINSKKVKNSARSSAAFTVVELLIVIVVIGILATLVFVGYRGVQQRAAASTLKSDLSSSVDKLKIAQLRNEGNFPTGDSELVKAAGTTLDYRPNGDKFCLSATSNRPGTPSYKVTDEGSIVEGNCAGYNEFAGPSLLIGCHKYNASHEPSWVYWRNHLSWDAPANTVIPRFYVELDGVGQEIDNTLTSSGMTHYEISWIQNRAVQVKVMYVNQAGVRSAPITDTPHFASNCMS